ncbi:MAG: phosphate transport system regulatory protein PhoU [Verrucomicrobiaceae bacterium]|jgi:phosphate transport system protein|nr:phosphate transport system regulatory protein PhoU [Verrucomicrobiaceae bacterium]|tara:strand:+ start:624 stop:1316 length:693 start_codon:yes stop_codon:yes gene_type:complete
MPDETPHILGKFQDALDKISADLNSMADQVTSNLEMAVRGLTERDSTLCDQVIADDAEVDLLEMKIDEEGLRIMTLYQPVATDLRRVISVMKVSGNLERVGDQAVSIARRARKMNRNLEIAETRLVEPVYKKAISLLQKSLGAFAEGNLEHALEIRGEDAELNEAQKSVSKQLTSRMENDSARIKDYLDLQFIVRWLERVGDHAKNIAEEAVFVTAAMDIRHGAERPEVE